MKEKTQAAIAGIGVVAAASLTREFELIASKADPFNLVYFFLNFSILLVAITSILSLVALVANATRGTKLKTFQYILAYQIVCGFLGGILFIHYQMFWT